MILINGNIYDPNAPEVLLLNRSFKYGDGLFETIRIHIGKPLFWEAHLERLFGGMHALKFEFDVESFAQTLKKSATDLITTNKINQAGKLRIHVFRAGEGTFLPNERTPVYLIEATSLEKDYFKYPKRITLTSYPEHSIFYSPLSAYKTANSLPYILGAMHAKDTGFDDAALFCGEFVSETTAANIFLVTEKSKIITPPLHHGCLPGIMREQIFHLLKASDRPVEAKPVRKNDLEDASEIFITNSMVGIATVSKFEHISKKESFGKNLQEQFRLAL